MKKKYKHTKIALIGFVLVSGQVSADCPDWLELKPGAGSVVGSLIHDGCDAVADLAQNTALGLLNSIGIALGILQPKPDTPALVDLTEASLQKIEDIIERQISSHLREYAYSDFEGRAAAIEQGTIHYDAIVDEGVKLSYLMNRFLPDVFEITNDGVFFNDLNDDTYALSIPYAAVANAYLNLVNRAVNNGQYDVYTAFTIVRDIRNRLWALNQSLYSTLRRQVTTVQSYGCYSLQPNDPRYHCRISVRSPAGSAEFTSDDFPPGTPPIAIEAAAGSFAVEMAQKMYDDVDKVHLIRNTLNLYDLYKEKWEISSNW
ncbi:hypothetical protein FKG94_19645 [Exilibacterium tricleocarpae]|uniref:Uncharacterized protein n=2 Tax=Exilibacterium tricleocarpae TaxID=2591008 RepID=A0A545T284_9GAMM|nr:hypothetical protein FKG94_19645 [Exilibacterium tricleocarpae]